MPMPDFYSHSPIIQRVLQGIPVTWGLHDELAGQHALLTGGAGFFRQWLLALLYQLNLQGGGWRFACCHVRGRAFSTRNHAVAIAPG
ncbi:hypothetical protein PSEUDO8Z_100114 [Pseudomonas sp. 8Z]|nr:hypothetical protein PSEUDO8Z_100114 [Pseudomonas sp. 8Z]